MVFFTNIQDHLFRSYDISFEERQKLDSFLSLLEDSGVGNLIDELTFVDKSKGGRNSYNPFRLFAAIVYAFSKHSGSLRKIEESITFDLRFLYLMDGNIPSYVTISKFLNNVVVKCSKKIFYLVTNAIINRYSICIDDVFLDGTKLEANANKYKFVWKPGTFKDSLCLNIKNLLLKHFNISNNKKNFVSKEIANHLSCLANKITDSGIDISTLKTGKGIRNTELVKDYFLLNKYLIKLLEYEEKENTCGPNRNSFYKTDKDATAMCLKSDYYSGLGSSLHAAYNTQILVSRGIILDFIVSQDRNDMKTLIPSLESFYSLYGHYPKRLCANAGYGSLINYRFLVNNKIIPFVKFPDWSLITSGVVTTPYTFKGDDLYCLNNKKGIITTSYNGRHPHANTVLYVIENCRRCKFKDICNAKIKQVKNFRVFETNKELYDYKNMSLDNLLSPKGIEMRINRSSQVEGVFGVIKQDMDYERIRRRGMENVTSEIMLVFLGYNIRKLFTLIEGKSKLDYWVAPENLEHEKIKSPTKKYKKAKKGKNEELRSKYKKKKRR